MPFKSESQRRTLWANEPKVAEAWAHGSSSVTGKKEGKAKNKGLPMHFSKSKKASEKGYKTKHKGNY